MGGGNQGFEVLGPAVARIRRKGQHTVVAPVARAGEVRDGHELDGGHAQRGQMVEFGGTGAEGALGGEAPDVQFVDHGLAPGAPPPVDVDPGVVLGIDDFARALDVGGLEARGRVGDRQAVREHETVAAAGVRPIGGEAEPAVRGGRERQRLRIVNDDVDRPDRRSPECESNLAVALHFRAEAHAVPAACRRRRGRRPRNRFERSRHADVLPDVPDSKARSPRPDPCRAWRRSFGIGRLR